MGKGSASRGVVQAPGKVERRLIVGGIRLGFGPPADHPVSQVASCSLFRTENLEQACEHFLRGLVEIHPCRFRGKGDERIRIVQAETERTLRRPIFFINRQQPIGR